MRFIHAILFGAILLAFQSVTDMRLAHSATWPFGSNANGLTNLTSKTLPPNDALALQLSVHNPAVARFFEGDSAGLTVNSTGLAGIVDRNGAGKINLLDVNGVPAAAAESIAFSFDKPGMLTGIDFDGVKDESLEYFILTSAGGRRINFFDSFANTSIPGAVGAAIGGQITGEVVYLLEMGPHDDEAIGLHIPFVAGQEFVVTYAELAPVAHQSYEPGNGARLQGITAETVPEPTTLLMLFAGGMLMWTHRGGRSVYETR